MLQARDLRKSFGKLEAVRGVSFEVANGEIVGLLGPNGAGKSTTVAMLCGITVPDRGDVTIGGEAIAGDASALKRRIGLVPQDISLFEDLPAIDNVKLFGALYGLDGERLVTRANAAMQIVGLADRAREKPAKYSGGMKRRLNIACALVHDPEVLLLDEPTAGVDPQSRNAIFSNLESLRAAGKAIVYTTHYMEEAERLCDRIVVMDHGAVIAAGTLAQLRAMAPKGAPRPVEPEGPSLEDVFLHLTGRQLRD